MALTKEQKDNAIRRAVEELSIRLVEEYKVSKEEGIRKVLLSKTYMVLLNTKNKLYLESDEYIYYKLKLELEGNRTEWDKY